MKKCVGFASLMMVALIIWIWPTDVGDEERSLDVATVIPTKSRRIHRKTPIPTPAAAPVAMQQALPLEWIHVQLRSDPTLQQHVAVFHSFDPTNFLPSLLPEDLPDSPTADALLNLLDEDHEGGLDAIDDFLDAIDQDPELDGFDTNAIDIIDLETERLLALEEFDAVEAEVATIFDQVSDLSDEAALDLIANMPRVELQNEELMALAKEIIDEDPLHEGADLARLYAAWGLTDYSVNWPNESMATELLLDTLANSETPAVQQQVIRMLVDMTPQEMHPGDIELLEHTWYTLDDDDQSQLSRFLTAQHFATGDLARAEVWADRFEAEVLSGDMTLPAHDEFLREIDHVRARIGARRADSAPNWRAAAEQSAWACWEGPEGEWVTATDDRLEIVGFWNDGWTFQAKTPDHPLSECILAGLIEIDDPSAPVRVRISIKIFGLQG